VRGLRRGLALAGVVAGALVVGPVATAGATLAYATGGFPTSPPKVPSPVRVWVARDTGAGARRLATGDAPSVSPNGRQVLYGTFSGAVPRLFVVPAAGGRSRTLLRNWEDSGAVAWAPNSRTVAAVTGPELGTKRLILIDAASGRVLRTVATAPDFGSVSFAPNGSGLVYSVSVGQTGSDIFTAATAGGAPVALSRDHRSSEPVWGRHWIVFSKSRPPSRRNDAPKLDLYLVEPNGQGLHRLTHTNSGFLLSGLVATAWSADGTRLLTEFTGQDTSYPETVNPTTGQVRRLGTPAQGLLGYALSRNGRTVLASTGGPDPSDSNVVTIPYTGGPLRVLARHARSPSWNS
jgi:Tol biopolymer transport system component